MSTDLKNYGIRFSNVLRPIQNKDTHPLIVANDALGGLHITRSLAEIEKSTQRLMIGMEVVSLNEETAFDGKPEYGRWRLKDMTITCNHSSFNCPLYASLKSNKKCLFEHPNCRITKKKNFIWERLYDDEPTKYSSRWSNILDRPWQLKFIAADISLPNFYTDNITLNINGYNKPIEMLASDGKIDARLLRNDEIKVADPSPKTIFFNERVLIDHSFFTAEEWASASRPSRLNKINSISVGEKTQQVNLSLMYNLVNISINSKAHLNYLRLANTKITILDLRNIKEHLEELILDDNPDLREVYVNDKFYDNEETGRIPLKRISVKNCPNLQIISISGSQVQTIDLRGCINLRRLYADNTQITSIICQETYIGKLQPEDKYKTYGGVIKDTIHYFFRHSAMNEIAFEGVYRTLFDADDNYCIVLHTGWSKYSTNSKTEIATDKGHIVCFCEDETF